MNSISISSRLLVFLVWPFLALVYSIANYKARWAKNIVWAFSGFLGYTFVISNEGMDANRYRDKLILLHESNVGLKEFYSGVLDGTYGRSDFLEPTIRYITSCFTDDYRILFAFFGLTMGFFFSRNIWFFLGQVEKRVNLISIPFLLLLIIAIPTWQINGFRFWTACHILIYGLIAFYYQKAKVRGVFFILLSMLAHVSFVVLIPICLIYFVIRQNRIFLLVLLTFSLFLLQVDIPFLLQFIPDNLAGPGEIYIDGYLKSDKAKNMLFTQNNQRWFLRLNQMILPVAFSVLAYFYLLIKQKNYRNSYLGSLISFAILLFSIINIFQVVPSVGRFYSIAYILLGGVFFVIMNNETKSLWNSRLSLFVAPVFLLFVLIQFRVGFDFLGIGLFLFNPLIAWASENSLALVDLYK